MSVTWQDCEKHVLWCHSDQMKWWGRRTCRTLNNLPVLLSLRMIVVTRLSFHQGSWTASHASPLSWWIVVNNNTELLLVIQETQTSIGLLSAELQQWVGAERYLCRYAQVKNSNGSQCYLNRYLTRLTWLCYGWTGNTISARPPRLTNPAAELAKQDAASC